MKIVAAMLLAFTISLPLIQGEVMNSEDATHGLIDVTAKIDKEKPTKPRKSKCPMTYPSLKIRNEALMKGILRGISTRYSLHKCLRAFSFHRKALLAITRLTMRI